MNGHWLLNPIATSVKNATVFYLDYYIHAAFLLALFIIVYVTATETNTCNMAFVSYAY